MADLIKLSSKGVILAEVESTYGTDPTPTAAANAIRVEDIKVAPTYKSIDRNYSQPYMGARSAIKVGESCKVTFKTELKGDGAAGVRPEIHPLLVACNFTDSDQVTPTRVDYSPNSLLDSASSITIYAYVDGLMRKICGCRGTFSLELKAGEIGYINWEFTGIFAVRTDTTIVTPTLNATLPPRFISASFTYASVAAVISSLKYTCGNDVARRPSVNADTGTLQFFIKSRKMTMNIDPEVVALATKNWETALLASTTGAITGTLGSATGNNIIITAPAAQIDSLSDADREGILTHDMPLVLVPSSGNDEVKFSFR